MLEKYKMTYGEMLKGLQDKIHECRIEISALEEEKETAMHDFGIDGYEYDEWIEEQHQEISRLHHMIRNLQEIYREVR